MNKTTKAQQEILNRMAKGATVVRGQTGYETHAPWLNDDNGSKRLHAPAIWTMVHNGWLTNEFVVTGENTCETRFTLTDAGRELAQ